MRRTLVLVAMVAAAMGCNESQDLEYGKLDAPPPPADAGQAMVACVRGWDAAECAPQCVDYYAIGTSQSCWVDVDPSGQNRLPHFCFKEMTVAPPGATQLSCCFEDFINEGRVWHVPCRAP